MIFICLNILTINLLVLTINSESPFAPNEEQIKANWNIFKSNHGYFFFDFKILIGSIILKLF